MPKTGLEKFEEMVSLKPPRKVTRIPALVGSKRGFLHKNELAKAVEFRIWVHPMSGGDDYYHVYGTLQYAASEFKKLQASGNYRVVEYPIAVVREPKHRSGYAEISIS